MLLPQISIPFISAFRFEQLRISALTQTIEEKYEKLFNHFGKEIEIVGKVFLP